MSFIHSLLTSIGKAPGITAQELADEAKQDTKRVRNNLHQAKHQGWITTKLDDITRQPGYHLTASGKAKVADGADDDDDTQEATPNAAPTTPPSAAETASQSEREADTAELSALRSQCETLENMVHNLAAERDALRAAAQEKSARIALDASAEIVGYLVAATKRKPRRIRSAVTAGIVAAKAVRGGAARADVFALTPVATARRGVEWTDPKED